MSISFLLVLECEKRIMLRLKMNMRITIHVELHGTSHCSYLAILPLPALTTRKNNNQRMIFINSYIQCLHIIRFKKYNNTCPAVTTTPTYPFCSLFDEQSSLLLLTSIYDSQSPTKIISAVCLLSFYHAYLKRLHSF